MTETGPPLVSRRRARLWWVAAFLAALAVLGLAAREARPRFAAWAAQRRLRHGPRPDVLLVTLDSVRADRVGAYGHRGGATPHLDALGGEGVVFERTHTAAPLCLAAHASILTGLYPDRHGIHGPSDRLGDEAPTLAGTLRAAGYATAAFVSATSLDRAAGLDRGFDLYDDDLGPPGKTPGRAERSAAEPAVDRALAWLSAAGSRPVFLWVHLDEARFPPRPPESLAGRFPGEPYLAALASVDAEAGRLLRETRRRRPNVLAVAIADHGTGLGEHGEDGHGRFLYGTTTRVPFVLALPGRLPAGARVASLVRSVDVVPTLLDVIGLEAPPGLSGTSLVAAALGREPAASPAAVLENLAPRLSYGFSPLHAIRSGPYLYVRGELYDSAQDPAEADDLSARLPRVAGALERELAAAVPGLPTDPADPKGEREAYRRLQEAAELEGRGALREAIGLYEALLGERPGLVAARRRLSEVLLREGRLDESARVLRDLVERREAEDVTYLNLALAEYRLGRPDAALERLREGVRAFPRSLALRLRLGKRLLDADEAAEAARVLTETLGREPRLLDGQLALARALLATGRAEEAEVAYRSLEAMAPESEEGREAARALAAPGLRGAARDGK